MNQTRHKNKKDVINEPQQWYRNFMNEQSESLSLAVPEFINDEAGLRSQENLKKPYPSTEASQMNQQSFNNI